VAAKEQKYEQLVECLAALKLTLEGNQPSMTFANSEAPNQDSHSLSFFGFIDQIPSDHQLANRTLEPGWQISAPPKSVPWIENGPNGPSHSIRSIILQASACCRAPSAPIVAVLGLLNAGKSSLVSTYLSLENRRRVLVGSSNSQGTHRFVLWLPQSWEKEPELWNFVKSRLNSIFGCESELLSTDPMEAAKQYNDITPRPSVDAAGNPIHRATIEIPLLATDPELDRWGSQSWIVPTCKRDYYR